VDVEERVERGPDGPGERIEGVGGHRKENERAAREDTSAANVSVRMAGPVALGDASGSR
jgi:hypothetical protein